MSLLMEQAKKLYASGLSVSNIGERLGKTEQWVSAAVSVILPNETKEIPSCVTSPEFLLMKKTIDLHEKGMTKAIISRETGRKESWVIGTIAIMTKLPNVIHEAMGQDKVSRNCALQLLFAPSDKLEEICRAVVEIAEDKKL